MMINSDSVSDKGKQCSDLSIASTQQNVFFLTRPQSQFIQDARLCSPGAKGSKAKKEESIESYHRSLPWGVCCSLQALVWGSNKETWYEIVKINMRGRMFTAVTKHINEVCLLPNSGFACLIFIVNFYDDERGGICTKYRTNCKCYSPSQCNVRSQRLKVSPMLLPLSTDFSR